MRFEVLERSLSYLVDCLFVLRTSKKGIRDTLVSMIPQIVGVLTGLLSSILIARFLGPAQLGKYTLVLSFSSLLGGFSDLGIGPTAVRFASRAAALGDMEEHFGIMRWAFRLRLFLMCLTTLLGLLAADLVTNRLWQQPDLTALVRWALLNGVFTMLAAIPLVYFQSIKRFGVNSIVLTVQRLLSFLGICVLSVVSIWSVSSVLFVTIASSAIGAVAFLFVIPKQALFAPGGLDKICRECTKGFWNTRVSATETVSENSETPGQFAMYLLVSSLLLNVLTQSEIWLMGHYVHSDQLGIYSVALRLTLPISILTSGLTTALWPRASALGLSDAGKLLRRLLKISALLAALALIYAFVAPLLIPHVFGPAYRPGLLIGQLLCFQHCLALIISPLGVVGFRLGLARHYCLLNAMQLAAAVTLNVLLLPRLGALGAAIANLMTAIIALVAGACFLTRALTKVTRPTTAWSTTVQSISS